MVFGTFYAGRHGGQKKWNQHQHWNPIWRVGHGGWLIGPILFWPEAYPTCVSFKLSEFIFSLEAHFIKANTLFVQNNEIRTFFCPHVFTQPPRRSNTTSSSVVKHYTTFDCSFGIYDWRSIWSNLEYKSSDPRPQISISLFHQSTRPSRVIRPTRGHREVQKNIALLPLLPL